jgi:hypothetical protein
MFHHPYDLGVGLELGYRKDSEAWFLSLAQSASGNLSMLFGLSDAPKPFLVVEFYCPEVVRTADEFWLSTEDHKDWAGDLTHFCRTVEGATYPTSMEWMRQTRPKALHYQFVTGDTCVEVMSEHPPQARLANIGELPNFDFVPKPIED